MVSSWERATATAEELVATADERWRWGGALEARVRVARSRGVAGMASEKEESRGLLRPGQFPTGKRALPGQMFVERWASKHTDG
jgi:hypothetical protein